MIDELASLRELIGTRQPTLIGIDGMNGVGKTRRVTRPLGMRSLSTDDYLLGNRSYLEGLDYQRLGADLAELPRPAIVEGCCLLAVLHRIGVSLSLHVYVRSLSENGFWHDADICEGEMLEHVLARNRAIAKAAKAGRSNLDHDLAVYHHRFQPYQSADFVLDLVERPAD